MGLNIGDVQISTDQLLQELEAKYWKLGQFPGVEDIDADPTMCNPSTYIKRIGLLRAKRIIMQRIQEAQADADTAG